MAEDREPGRERSVGRSRPDDLRLLRLRTAKRSTQGSVALTLTGDSGRTAMVEVDSGAEAATLATIAFELADRPVLKTIDDCRFAASILTE